MSDLVFNVKGVYFRQVEAGLKDHEYREVKPYWVSRLKNNNFTGIIYKLGYPKDGDESRIKKFGYNGYFKTKVNLMGQGIKTVFAFPLRASK